MFVKELESQAQYFLIDDPDTFASVSYGNGKVAYSFTIYGRMLQAMVDGYDEVQIQIAKKMPFKYRYFKGSTPADIENATVGFVQNVTTELQDQERRETIAGTRFSINSFVSDQNISNIGSGIITAQNYTDYLDVMDITTSSPTNSNKQLVLSDSGLEAYTTSAENTSPSIISNDLFENFGIFPGLISGVTFPRQCEMDRDSGKFMPANTLSDKMLQTNGQFLELYTHFFSLNSQLEMVTAIKTGKPEFQKITPTILFTASPTVLMNLAFKRKLLLRISLFKDGIEMVQENFDFNNYELFVRFSADFKDPSVELIVPDAIRALPDVVKVTNPNDFVLDVTLFKFLPELGTILNKEKLGEFTLTPKQTQYIESNTIFFDNSETRAYCVTANRNVGGIPGVGNVVSLKVPPTICKPTPETVIPMLTLEDDEGSVGITLSGMPDVGYTAVLRRVELGYLIETVLGKSNGNHTWTDDAVYDGCVFVYTARIFLNDGSSALVAETPAQWFAPKATALRLGFDITDATSVQTGGRVKQSFKITQTTVTTPAEQMLETVNTSGEAGLYEDELSAEKTDTSLVAMYQVYQYNKIHGSMSLVGVYPADKRISFSLRSRRARRMEYFVIPQVSAAASLSYLTVTEETDQATGSSYKISYKKWRDPMANRVEILPSTGEILRNNLYESLANSQSGLVKKVQFSTSGKTGVVKRLDADADVKRGFNFITWQFTGDLTNIAYFIVMASYNGVKAPVGMAIPDGRKKQELISYADKALAGALGVISYSVIPVTISGDLATESRSKSISNLSTYPSQALLRT